MQRADEAVREINSSVLGLKGAGSTGHNGSVGGKGSTPGNIKYTYNFHMVTVM